MYRTDMNPKQCIEKLMSLGWRESDIGGAVGVAQATINRIKHGQEARYSVALALLALAKKAKRRAA